MPVVVLVGGYATGNNSEVRAAPPASDSFINNTRLFIPVVEQTPGTVSFPASADLAEGSGTRAFSAVSTQPGDWIVVEVLMENDTNPNSNVGVSASGLTFDSQNDTGTAGLGSRSRVTQWTTLDSAGGSRTVTITPNSGTWLYRARLTVVRGSNGPGGKAVNATGQTVSVARTGTNSAVFMALSDWSTGSVGSPVWTPGGSTVASQQATGATYVLGRWDNAGSAGTASHGVSSPSYATPSIAVLEMTAAAGGGATEVFSDQITLTGQGSLVSSAANEVIASAALIGQGFLVASATNETTGSISLSGQSTLTTVGTRGVSASVVLTGQSTLTAIGNTAISGSVVMTGQSGLSASALVDVRASVALSGQATLAVVPSVNVRAATVLSSQSTLAASAVLTISGATVLTGQSALLTNSVVTTTGVAALVGQSALTVIGNVGAIPPTVTMTGQSALSVTGQNTVNANSVLSAQSVLSVTGQNTVRASTTLTGQSNVVAVGQNTVRASVVMLSQATLVASGNAVLGPIQAVLNGQSTLVVSASVIRVASANLSAVSSIAVSGTVTTRGSSVLSGQSSLSVIGTRIVHGTTALNGQSTLVVTGFIPAVVTGLVQMSSQMTVTVTANTTPPWVFPFIEFQAVQVINRDGSLKVTTIKESVTNIESIMDSTSSSSTMEGGG